MNEKEPAAKPGPAQTGQEEDRVWRRSARTSISSPAMLTAISAGVWALMAVPMGVYTRSSCSLVKPSARSFLFSSAVMAREPMTPR